MRVYLDNSATTRLDDEVMKAMTPYFSEIYGNASSLHAFGREALEAVDKSRETIASLLGAYPNEIYFTSGGTESDNWALKGAAKAYGKYGKHIVTTAIEHPAMMETCHKLEKEGLEVTYVGVNSEGLVDPEEIKKAVRDDTILVSVMFANNEMGAIQPIGEIGRFCREEGILFHTDAVQAAGTIKIDVKELNIDMLSLSAHKFHGPKGMGLLYLRNGVKIEKLIVGGHQERGNRAGTTNTPGIVGMAKALEIAVRDMEKNNEHMRKLRDYFIDRVEKEIPYCHLQFRLYRGGEYFNGARPQRNSGKQRFGVQFGQSGAVPRHTGYGGVHGAGAQFHTVQFRERDHQGRNRLYRRNPESGGGKAKELVAVIQTNRRRKSLCITKKYWKLSLIPRTWAKSKTPTA